MSINIRFISAGAGSGKTYRLTKDLKKLLADKKVRPSGVIATTFTRLAAEELRQRVRQELMASGQSSHIKTATQMGQAMIGTVNGVCGELLLRFAFEAGLSADQKVLEEKDGNRLFGEALASVLGKQTERIRKLNAVSHRLQIVNQDNSLNWRQEVLNLVNSARANNMSPSQLSDWGKDSANTLLANFPKASKRDMDSELLQAVNNALGSIDTEVDTTKGTATYLTFLNGIRAGLTQHRLTWAEWVKTSKTGPTKKSSELAEPVQSLAANFEKHPQLHHDIQYFCEEVFSVAAQSLDAYQRLKEKQGMLDFVDQEQRLYELLDHPHVIETLTDELDLLLVDEFQDTSPIQLALFMKLATLAKQVIWVGDIKQSIYSFRGSDPSLMLAVLEKLKDQGGQTDNLASSWRSRPSLVKYTNEIFISAFSDSLQEEQVALKPERKELTDEPAIAYWHLHGRNKAVRASALILGIQNLVASQHEIIDKQSGNPRSANYGDIAVLCRTNVNLNVIAEAMTDGGIPVTYRRTGLLNTPEGVLVMAGLRRVADPLDTLASAEIRTLTTGESPEAWLEDRIQFLESDLPAYQWGESGDAILPPLNNLKELRETLKYLSPVEVLELVISRADIRRIIISWGPNKPRTGQRLQNVDSLIEYAQQYEDHCNTRNLAATVSGLILWLYELQNDDEDQQAEHASRDSVTLVTHHRAKGLEWPVVISMDLDSKLKPKLWGLSVQPCTNDFDIDNPLNDRSLRYWTWPFGLQSTSINVKDELEASNHGLQAQQAAIEETRRLLYVSLTRPRDLLVIPLSGKNPGGEWLDTLGADWMLPTGDSLVLPSKEIIPTQYLELSAPDEVQISKMGFEINWLDSTKPHDSNILPLFISPSSAAPSEHGKMGEVIELGESIPITKVIDYSLLGTAIHNIIATEIRQPDDDAGSRTKNILKTYGLLEIVNVGDIICASRCFIEKINTLFKPINLYTEYPVNFIHQTGQITRGFIDLLIETEQGWLIIDHKSSDLKKSDWEGSATSYSGQLSLYQQAVNAASSKQTIGTWIYFPVAGGLVEIIT